MTCCATLTTEQRAAIEALRVEAEAAYHSLMIGGGIREFRDQNGEQIVYTSANRVSLLAYINQLRTQLGMCMMPGIVARPAGVFL